MEPAKVKFWHIRWYYPSMGEVVDGWDGFRLSVMYSTRVMNPKGGITLCRLTVDGQTSYGFAVCSVRDCYSKARGRQIAEGRARKAIKEETLLLPTERMPRIAEVKTGDVIRDFVKRDLEWRGEQAMMAQLPEMAAA